MINQVQNQHSKIGREKGREEDTEGGGEREREKEIEGKPVQA